MSSYWAHATAIVDAPVEIGSGTKVWHFSHVMPKVRIGENCSFGQNVFIGSGVRIGHNVKVQNNVSLYEGVELEDDVFCGPSCVFTNVVNPRSQVVRRGEYQRTLIRRGASIGANATIVCGSNIGRYAFIAAGAVVTKTEVPDYALMMGVPAVQRGWMSRHGHRLELGADGLGTCPESGWRYQLTGQTLRCLDWSEDQALPPA